MSASALLFQGKHQEVAKDLGKSQGVKAGHMVAESMEIGKTKAEKAKQSVADFMKQAHNAANTAYNTPVMSSARKPLEKTR